MRSRSLPRLKAAIKRLPLIGGLAVRIVRSVRPRKEFMSSRDFWERRYSSGGNSGAGSEGELAAFKASTINDVLRRYSIDSVVELGCGDGRQIALVDCPRYLGLDISPSAVRRCCEAFAGDDTKAFEVYDPTTFDGARLGATLALSIDVIFHLVEDDVFDRYMGDLFALGREFVLIYSSDREERPDPAAPQVRQRCFSNWIAARAPDWSLIERIENEHPYQQDAQSGSRSDFYLYRRRRAD